jgi:hypothetical protein
VTYRDDDAARAARLDALEQERVCTERLARGLDATLAGLGEDDGGRARRGAPRRASPGRDVGLTLGIIGGLVLGCVVGSAGVSAFGSTLRGDAVHLKMSGALAESTHPRARSGTPCIATVSGDDGTSGECHARVTCGATVLYDGVGMCATPSGDAALSYSAGHDDDGSSACFISEARHLAVIREAGWTARIATLVKQH